MIHGWLECPRHYGTSELVKSMLRCEINKKKPYLNRGTNHLHLSLSLSQPARYLHFIWPRGKLDGEERGGGCIENVAFIHFVKWHHQHSTISLTRFTEPSLSTSAGAAVAPSSASQPARLAPPAWMLMMMRGEQCNLPPEVPANPPTPTYTPHGGQNLGNPLACNYSVLE